MSWYKSTLGKSREMDGMITVADAGDCSRYDYIREYNRKYMKDHKLKAKKFEFQASEWYHKCYGSYDKR